MDNKPQVECANKTVLEICDKWASTTSNEPRLTRLITAGQADGAGKKYQCGRAALQFELARFEKIG